MQFGDEKCFFLFWTLYRFGGLDPTENIYKREHTHFWSDEFETAVQVQLEFHQNCIAIIASQSFFFFYNWI